MTSGFHSQDEIYALRLDSSSGVFYDRFTTGMNIVDAVR